MKISLILLLLLKLTWAQVDDCPLTPACCEDDCCGVGASYGVGVGCSSDPSSPGWTSPGQNSPTYAFGCELRACCEADCCVQGTIYDTSINYCVPAGLISGTVQGDRNNDDVGDIDLAGAPIKLLNSTGAVIATTVTNGNGAYVFYNVVPGSYSIMQTNIVTFPFDVSDSDAGDVNMIEATIGSGPGSQLNSTGNDFVDELARLISGVVLEDLDDNNTGDVPIPNVEVALIDANDQVFATTLTDTNGFFEFSAPPGTYTVIQTNLANFTDVSDTDTPAP